MLYQVETGALNRAVKRNIARFPEDFRFQLTKDEYENLKCQFGTSNGSGTENGYGVRRTLPYVFTEQGISMLASVLHAEYFWGMGYITVVLFAIIQNGAFQNDFIDFFRIPFMWYMRFCDWLVYPTYDNGFNQKITYTGGEAWVIRILAIVAVLFISLEKQFLRMVNLYD